MIISVQLDEGPQFLAQHFEFFFSMHHLTVPSQITWHLSWSDIFLLFQNLHTAISVNHHLQQVAFAGDNIVMCQNLQRVWQQFTEEVASECDYAAEVDLMPLENAIAIQQTYTQFTHHPALPHPAICQLLQLPVNSPLPLPGVEAGILMVSQHFCFWVQVQTHDHEEALAGHAAPPQTHSDVCTRWQVTIVLERQMICKLLKSSGLFAIAPHLTAPPTPPDRWQTAIGQCWGEFLKLTTSAPLSVLDKPQPPPCLFQPLLEQMPLGVFQVDLDGSFMSVNPAFCQLTGYSQSQLLRLDLQSVTDPQDFRTKLELIQQVVRYREQRIFEQRYRRADGTVVWAEVKLSLVGDPEDSQSFLLGFVTDLSDRRQIEAERLHAIQDIQQRQERETLINNIAIRIRSAIDLPTMLQNAVAELNGALRSDRVIVYQFAADGSGQCVSEAVNPQLTPMQGQSFGADCIPPPYLDAYRTGRIWSIDHVSQAELTGCHRQMLEQVQVQSMIATGILSMDDSLKPDRRRLWGLLVVHQCHAARQWTSADLHLVEAVANQLAIALEQTKLLNQLTLYTQELEQRVHQRTQSLEQSLKFEQFIRSLTECLYCRIDTSGLFQTVVQGLVSTLNVDICLVSLYNAQQNTFEVKFEAVKNSALTSKSFLGCSIALENLPHLLLDQSFNENTFRGETNSFSSTLDRDYLFLKSLLGQTIEWTDSATHLVSQISRPIMGADHPVGIVTLLQSQPRQFNSGEMELVEQTTNYCAIALRQFHLYRQEHEQRLSAEYLRSFLEKSIDVYVEYDEQLRYITINPIGCNILGRPLHDIIGKTNQELFADDASEIEHLLQQAFTTAEKVFVNHEMPLQQETRMFESVYAPITDPTGTVQRVIGICRDVTELKQQWQLLESQNHQLAETTRLKEEFIATTSHELRTPLTAILGFSNILLQEFVGDLNPKQKDYVERIHASGQHLLELINDILDLSRLEAGRVELDPQMIYISEVCEAVMSIIQERAISQGLTLEIDLASDVEWMIADPRRLKQMLLNLLSNAIKFTPQGSVGLKVYCEGLEMERSPVDDARFRSFTSTSLAPFKLIHFRIWDTGIGIAESDQRLLFAPFSQIDSSLSRKHQGTGLGLVITQRLAELHGGWVVCKSSPNQGSQFTVSLPWRSS